MGDDKPVQCMICSLSINSDESTVKLTQKGCDGINIASTKRQDSIHTVPGQSVHSECRRVFCNPNIIARDKLQNNEISISRSNRSKANSFVFKEKCLFCGQTAKYNQRKRGHDVYQVRTLDFQRKIIDMCLVRDDRWANEVRGRLESVVDLPAADALYHQTCNVNFRTKKDIPYSFSPEHEKPRKLPRGRPRDQESNMAFSEIIEFLEQNDNEQITISELVDKMKETSESKAYSAKYMKQKLEQHFGDRIMITELNGKHNVVTLRNTASAIVQDFYSQSKSLNADLKENHEMIKSAAKVIKIDIQSTKCDRSVYPSPNKIESTEENMKFVPDSLLLLLSEILGEKSADMKICAIGQAIMQACRPRTILAPLQLGLAVQLHHHFASKFLIETLNSLGFCVSYSEVQMFESNAAVSNQTDIDNFSPGMFLQYAADNVDHNLRTLDGHNTFHGMGMIACVTPENVHNRVVPRQKVSTEDILSAGKMNISFFRSSESTKPSATFADLVPLRIQDTSWKLTFLAQVTWPLRAPGPEWSGLMQMVRKGEYPGRSSVIFLPMIDMDPTDMSCIYTTLKYIGDHAQKYSQIPVITFDQPLYWKAVKVLLHEEEGSLLKDIVLRLGGFHCVMSFLGCIGQLMTGSGLSELMETLYASNTISHILSGKAVARAIRGHFLIDNALNVYFLSKYFLPSTPIQLDTVEQNGFHCNDELKIEHVVAEGNSEDLGSCVETVIIEDNEDETLCSGNEKADSGSTREELNVYINDSDTEYVYDQTEDRETIQNQVQAMVELYRCLVDGDIPMDSLDRNNTIDTVSKLVTEKKHQLLPHPTSALWIQYMDMVDILRLFLTAERTGNWELSLDCLHKMLPYFAAAGHNHYLKSAYFYIQSMQTLQENNHAVYLAFKSGHHVVRRSDRFWGGLSPDLVIEQVLMRSVKTTGGLTRGKGLTESQRTQWLLSMPSCAEVNNAMQSFCGNEYHTSSQHKELGTTRIDRDHKDTRTLLSFITERNPFREDGLLCNIETGVTADPSVNAYNAKQVGDTLLKAMIGQNIFAYSFKRNQKARTFDTVPSARVDDDIVKVDPQLMFQRLTAAAQRCVEDIPRVFSYELCSVPTSLFDSTGLLRKAQKASLADAIWSIGDCSGVAMDKDASCVYVLDGGSLLHRIPWTKGMLFSQICESYVQHVSTKYQEAMVVFDGYLSGPTTKDTAHARRTHGISGTKVVFKECTPFTTKKEQFLTNVENKQNFIFMLSTFLEKSGYNVVHAESDADLLITHTAVEIAKKRGVVVIGEDTDLIVLLLYHANNADHRIYFKSDLKMRSSKGLRTWDILETKAVLGPALCRVLPVIHAFSGCDATSQVYGISKNTFLRKFRSETQLVSLAEVFLSADCKHEDITVSGERILVSIYGGLQYEGLDTLRFRKFATKVMASSSCVQVQTLPPTSSAAKYHSLRSFYQVQEWLGSVSNLSPLDWGWIRSNDRFIPVKTDLAAAPTALLKMIRCNCKHNCDSKRCTCRKNGLECSFGCGECRGISCTNTSSVSENDLSNDI